MTEPDDDIRYMVTDAGVDIRFPRPVTIQGTMWGTRIALTNEEAVVLHTRLAQYLNLVPCTCSKLSLRTDYRCLRHPGNRAKTPDEQRAFAAAFDAHIDKTQETGK